MMLRRLANSTVAWSWVLTVFQRMTGLILLPVVLHVFTPADLGMYYVFLSLVALVPVIDFGFSPTVGRFVSYAMGGAETLQAQGVPTAAGSGGPNYPLLWELLETTRKLYRYLTLGLFVVLGIWGTYTVELRIHETSSPLITRLAWATTLAATLLDVYSSWWNVFLRGLNDVRGAAQTSVIAAAIRFALALALLLGGAGLLSLPVATLLSCIIQRLLARLRCLAVLKTPQVPKDFALQNNLRILWPNSWRVGVHYLSSYLTTNANVNICLHVFGLAANAQYGLSLQLMSLASSMAYIWISIKWPLIGQYQARRDHSTIRRVLWPRIWLQNLSFFGLAAGAVFCAPYVLSWIGKGKEMLPMTWMLVLSLDSFLSLQFITWTTLISTGNRYPFLWPAVASNTLSLGLSLALVHFSSLGLGALVLGPLLAGCLFNYWYWPLFAARGLGTPLLRFLFVRPPSPKTEETVLA